MKLTSFNCVYTLGHKLHSLTIVIVLSPLIALMCVLTLAKPDDY